MDETPSATTLTASDRLADSFPIAWLAASIVATTAVSLAAAHAPPRVRLIGWFSIAFGLLIGWILARLVDILEVEPSRRFVGILAAILSFIGLVGSMWETVRLDESRRSESSKERLAESLIEQMKTETKDNSTIPIDTSALSAFRWHLSRRIRQLGHWPSPWPEVLWIVELITASLASAWMSNRCRSVNSPMVK